MKKVLLCMLMTATVYSVTAQTKPKVVAKPAAAKPVAKGVFKNLLDSFSYAAGYNVASNMKQQNIGKLNPVLMQKAIDDVYNNKQPLLTMDQMNA